MLHISKKAGLSKYKHLIKKKYLHFNNKLNSIYNLRFLSNEYVLHHTFNRASNFKVTHIFYFPSKQQCTVHIFFLNKFYF